MTSVVVSVVSHGQNALAKPLIDQLLQCPNVSRVILTCNIPEADRIAPAPKLDVIENQVPKGFSANHNAAFGHARKLFAHAPLFCVLNPDITLNEDPFPQLSRHFTSSVVGLAAPRIISPHGKVEDSARPFPTVISLSRKLFGLSDPDHRGDPNPLIQPDWVAGMFLLLRASTFSEIGGFDERFHLYYEDVDLCARLRCASKVIVYDATVSVIHDARRDSRRNLRYLTWHVASLLRYFKKRLQQPRAYCGKR